MNVEREQRDAMIDTLRRDTALRPLDAAVDNADPPLVHEDHELRRIFLCCSPVLSRAAQIALALNAAFGFTCAQIAAAFGSDEPTITHRVRSAKQRLRDERIQFEIPDGGALPSHLAAVLDVLYIVFSEGYRATCDAAPDIGLCAATLRLVRLLTYARLTAVPDAFALRALLCFHSARLPARVGDDGSLLLISEQDPARLDRALLAEAFWCRELARTGSGRSRFHLKAAIAACHALGSMRGTTEWSRIVDLYELLRERAPTVAVDVNRALAIAMCSGARAGLDELDAIPERDVLMRHPYALVTYADLHASLGNIDQARACLDRALAQQMAPAQRAMLRRKHAALATRVAVSGVD